MNEEGHAGTAPLWPRWPASLSRGYGFCRPLLRLPCCPRASSKLSNWARQRNSTQIVFHSRSILPSVMG